MTHLNLPPQEKTAERAINELNEAVNLLAERVQTLSLELYKLIELDSPQTLKEKHEALWQLHYLPRVLLTELHDTASIQSRSVGDFL